MDRFSRLRSGMRRLSIDVMLCFSPENIHYTTGGFNSGYQSTTVIAMVATAWPLPALLVDAVLKYKAVQTPGYRTVDHYGSWYGLECLADRWQDALYIVLKRISKFPNLAIGIEREIRADFRDDLAATFPDASLIVISDLLNSCRLIKEPAEIKNAKMATDIANCGMRAAIANLRLGKSEQETVWLAKDAMARIWREKYPNEKTDVFGSNESGLFDGFQCRVLVGERAFTIAEGPTTRCASNEVVSVIIWTAINGYHAELKRSVCVGTVSKEQRKLVSDVIEIREQLIGFIKPDVCFNEAYARACYYLAASGYAAPRRIGHTIGLGPHEEGSIDGASTTVFQPGMLITVEPRLYIPGKGVAQISDTFLIVEDGCQYLTPLSTETGEISPSSK